MGSETDDLLHDKRRLAVLHDLGLLDTPREEAFDALTRLATRLLDVPVALITLVDEDRMFFKSSSGLQEPWKSRRGTPIDYSFCRSALDRSDPLVIPNAREDPRVAHSRSIEEIGIESYLGAPLVSSGFVLGTFSVFDTKPRKWTDEEIASVSDFATNVITAIELQAAHVRLGNQQMELLETKTRLEALISAAPVAIWSVDERGDVGIWSRGAERLFGYSRDDVVGGPPPISAGSVLDAALYEEMNADLARGEGVEDFETTAHHKSGLEIPVQIWTAPLEPEGGGGSMAIAADITERLENERKRAELELRVAQSDRMEAVGRVAGVVAHDFNNLLTAIQGYASLAGSRTDSEGIDEDISEILSAAERAGELTKQLLTFSSGRPVQPDILDVGSEIRDLSGLLEQLVGPEHSLEIAVDGDPVWTSINKTHLEQVVVNLVVNARDASPANAGIQISVASATFGDEQPAAGDGILSPGEYCEISVSDDGDGVPPEVRAKIFEPFFTTKEDSGGTGLGLATVYAIVKQRGGAISLDARSGGGTKARVLLPVVAGGSDVDPPAQLEIEPVSGATVLVVDDDYPIRNFVARVLEDAGYEVLTADGGQRALAIANTGRDRIDLLLTDLSMPRMSGTALAAQLRGMPVVFMSGYFARSGEVGNRPFLQKPFSQQELLSAVASVIGAAKPSPLAG